nr:hypothetical protein [Amylibacter sp.]
MSEESRSNPALAFIVGALVVAVAGLGWYVYSGGGGDKADIEITLPDVNSNG